MHGSKNLLTEAQSSDQIAIALDIVVFEVVQETTTTTDEHLKTTSAVVVVCIRFEVFGQNVDALGEEGNLNFGRTRIALVTTKFADDLGFNSFVKHHTPSLSMARRPNGQNHPARNETRRTNPGFRRDSRA